MSSLLFKVAEAEQRNATNVGFLEQVAPQSLFGGQAGQSLATVLNQIFYVGLVAAVALALFMVVRGGVQYMTTDSIDGKGGAKARIQAALGGLVLAFSAILILSTINPSLVTLSLKFDPVQLAKQSNAGISGSPSGITSGTRPGLQPGQTIQITANGIMVVNPDGTTFRPEAVPSMSGNFTSGTATHFGYQDSMDNGRGSPHLDPNKGSGISTNNTSVYGVALPEEVLMRELGLPAITNDNWAEWAPARNAGVLVTDGTKSYIVPLVDIGPGEGPLSRGVVMDETQALNNAFGGDGKRSYQIIPNYYQR